jgi:hypothetical protein
MSAFEVVAIIVGVVGVALALTPFFSTRRTLTQLGHGGRTWFERPEDRAPDERPSDDERDAPIPQRPLRGRPRDWD